MATLPPAPWRQGSGGQTLGLRESVDTRPRSGSRWVSGLWQKLSAVTGAGECAEGKRVPKKGRCFASIPLGAVPVACEGDTRYRSPRAAKAPAPSSRAHHGAEGPAAPKPSARAAQGTGGCDQREQTTSGTFPFFISDNPRLRVSRSWGMRRQKNGILGP